MAKGPGPILALAGLAALFMMGKKDDRETPGTIFTDFEDEDVGLEEDELPSTAPPPSKSGGTQQQPSDPPPNVSGNTKYGYDAGLWVGPSDVRAFLKDLGYNVVVNDEKVPGAVTKQFQRNYNQASDKGQFGAVGHLLVDGEFGKNTLNALSVIHRHMQNSPQPGTLNMYKVAIAIGGALS